MSDFKTRLVEEKDQLGGRIEKLDTFINGDNFSLLDPTQRDLLTIQFRQMQGYYACLDLRLKTLK